MTRRLLTSVLLVTVSALLAACSGTGSPTDDGARTLTTAAVVNTHRSDTSDPPDPTTGSGRSVGRTANGSGRTAAVMTGWGPTRHEWRRARRAAAGMSDRELAGQVIVARYAGTASPTALVARYHLGGVIVMGDNVASVAQIAQSNATLQAGNDRPWPLVLTVDQEGGIVARLGAPMTDFPAFMSQGAARSAPLARSVARASGQELRAAGFTMVFAPDADVTVGPADPTIGSRSAGSDPRLVARIVLAAVDGYRSAGIVPVVKHFPGHGSVTADSHVTLPVQDRTLAQLRRRDFVPFARAIGGAAPAVMVGHIALGRVAPGVPADLSKRDVALLTSDLGFHGMVVTDALEMAAVTDDYTSGDAAVAALDAGVDMLLMPADTGSAFRGILAGLKNGSLPRSRLTDAAATIIALMMHERGQQPAAPSAIGSHTALSRRLSSEAATLVQGKCAGPYVGSAVTPMGDPEEVSLFEQAARRVGLRIGGGETVALLGYGEAPVNADVVVSLDTPYVLGAASASTAEIALFGAGEPAMSALVRVLIGKATAPGRLPVAVPGVDPPDC